MIKVKNEANGCVEEWLRRFGFEPLSRSRTDFKDPIHRHKERRRRLTELFGATVVQNLFVGRIETDAAHHVADLCAVDETVTTVPEVEEIEHFFHVCRRHNEQIEHYYRN